MFRLINANYIDTGYSKLSQTNSMGWETYPWTQNSKIVNNLAQQLQSFTALMSELVNVSRILVIWFSC